MLIYYKSDCISDNYGKGCIVLCYDTIKKCYIDEIHEDYLFSFATSKLQCLVAESPCKENISFHFAVQYLRYIDMDSYNRICSTLYTTFLDYPFDQKMYEKAFDSCNEDVELFQELVEKHMRENRNGFYFTYQ